MLMLSLLLVLPSAAAYTCVVGATPSHGVHAVRRAPLRAVRAQEANAAAMAGQIAGITEADRIVSKETYGLMLSTLLKTNESIAAQISANYAMVDYAFLQRLEEVIAEGTEDTARVMEIKEAVTAEMSNRMQAAAEAMKDLVQSPTPVVMEGKMAGLARQGRLDDALLQLLEANLQQVCAARAATRAAARAVAPCCRRSGGGRHPPHLRGGEHCPTRLREIHPCVRFCGAFRACLQAQAAGEAGKGAVAVLTKLQVRVREELDLALPKPVALLRRLLRMDDPDARQKLIREKMSPKKGSGGILLTTVRPAAHARVGARTPTAHAHESHAPRAPRAPHAASATGCPMRHDHWCEKHALARATHTRRPMHASTNACVHHCERPPWAAEDIGSRSQFPLGRPVAPPPTWHAHPRRYLMRVVCGTTCR